MAIKTVRRLEHDDQAHVLLVFGKAGDWSGAWENGDEADLRLEKPCPFCGDRFPRLVNVHTPVYKVICHSCGARGPVCMPLGWDAGRIRTREKLVAFHEEAQMRAINAWNERSTK